MNCKERSWAGHFLCCCLLVCCNKRDFLYTVDRTRVTLWPYTGMVGSDYINASFVDVSDLCYYWYFLLLLLLLCLMEQPVSRFKYHRLQISLFVDLQLTLLLSDFTEFPATWSVYCYSGSSGEHGRGLLANDLGIWGLLHSDADHNERVTRGLQLSFNFLITLSGCFHS